MSSTNTDALESMKRRLLTGYTEPNSRNVENFLAEFLAQPFSELGVSTFAIGIFPSNGTLFQSSLDGTTIPTGVVGDIIKVASKHEIRSLCLDIEGSGLFFYSENLGDWCILMGDINKKYVFELLLDSVWYQFFENA